MKMKSVYRKVKNFFKTYGKLPHVWILLIIIIFSITALLLSAYYMDKHQFLSSLYANIFAGLLTGVIICLVSTIKTMVLYKTESRITWLSNLHENCLEFMKMSRKLIFYKFEDFKSYDEVNDYIYDVLCFGHGINVTISQSQFKESLAFNPYEYCKKKIKYDSIEQEKIDDQLRERILCLNASQMEDNEIRELFREMERTFMSLNKSIIDILDELKVREKAINISML